MRKTLYNRINWKNNDDFKVSWKNEIAFASALAIAGSSLGLALGYVIPSLIVADFDGNSTHCQTCYKDTANLNSNDTNILQNQILILVSISTGLSILNLLGMLVFYDKDPVAPNKAERKRSKVTPQIQQQTTRQKIRKFFNSIKNILSNKNCRYLIVSQRNKFLKNKLYFLFKFVFHIDDK